MNADFMFKLNEQEAKELITNCDRFKTLKHSATTIKLIKDFNERRL